MNQEISVLAVIAVVLGLSLIVKFISFMNRDHKSHLIGLIKEEEMFYCPGIDAKCDADER